LGREYTLMQSVISKINISSENELVFLTALIQSSNIQALPINISTLIRFCSKAWSRWSITSKK
jgi:hypothetical protein